MPRLAPLGAVCAVLTVLCWSSFNVAAKHAIDAGLAPSAVSFLRFAVPGLIAVPVAIWWMLRGRALPVSLGRLALLVALGGPVFGLLAVSGYRYAPLSHGLLFAPVAAFLSSAVLAYVLLGERVTPARLAGAAVMFAGLAVLVGVQTAGLPAAWPLGAVFFAAAGAMWGAYTVLLKLWQIPMVTGTVWVAAGSALAAAVVLAPGAVPALRAAPWETVLIQAVMQGVVGGVLSVAAVMVTVRHVSAQVAGLLPTFTPAVGLGLAWAAFGTLPTVAELTGAAIIAVGFGLSAAGVPFVIGGKRLARLSK